MKSNPSKAFPDASQNIIALERSLIAHEDIIMNKNNVFSIKNEETDCGREEFAAISVKFATAAVIAIWNNTFVLPQ